MPKYTNTVEELLLWDACLLRGDETRIAAAFSALLDDTASDHDPLIFEAPRSAIALQRAIDAGVNLLRTRADGTKVLFEDGLHDAEAFAVVADVFARQGQIDAGNRDGMTALSSQVKFGALDKATILLEYGASANSVASNSRYGGQPLSVAQQAAMTMPSDPEVDRDTLSIKLLELLVSFDLALTPVLKEVLQRHADGKPKLFQWLKRL